MDRLERWTLKYSPHSKHVLQWSRYVDDVFWIWRGSDHQLNKFHEDLHKFDSNISFTLENGHHNLNFLDLNIKLAPDDINDGLISAIFSVYRKPSFTGISINNQSLHPTSHKLAVIKSAVNRLLQLPLRPDAFESETKTIEHIAKINSLQINVRLLIKRTSLRNSHRESRSNPTFKHFVDSTTSHLLPHSNPQPPAAPRNEIGKWIRVPYLGRPSELLARELRRYGYECGFYPVTRTIDLCSLKDPIPPQKRSGIYSLQCSCGSEYIGQSGRTFEKRFSEHRTDHIKMTNPKPTKRRKKPSQPSTLLNSSPSIKPETPPAMAQHCKQQTHNYNNVETTILHFCQKGARMNRLEEIYTLEAIHRSNRSGSNILNDLNAVFFNPFIRFNLDNYYSWLYL